MLVTTSQVEVAVALESRRGEFPSSRVVERHRRLPRHEVAAAPGRSRLATQADLLRVQVVGHVGEDPFVALGEAGPHFPTRRPGGAELDGAAPRAVTVDDE